MKKLISGILICILLVSLLTSAKSLEISTPKEEVVYGILKQDGSINELYVVNIFKSKNITDYGNYSKLINLTTSDKLEQNGDMIKISANSNLFYYQGTLQKNDLPWDVSIKYILDGKEIQASLLGGRSGNLKIAISIKQNENVNSIFFNNYALQVSLLLDNNLCKNIQAENATIAENGSKKQITYTVLPGNEIDISVMADVHDFEMDAISINGIKLSLGIEVDSKIFTSQLMVLTDAIKGLDDGGAKLLAGINQLSSGMQKYVDGLTEFNKGINLLSDGAKKLYLGSSSLSEGLAKLSAQNDSLKNGALAIQQSTFDSVNQNLGQMGLVIPVLTPENYEVVLSQIPSLSEVKNQLDSIVLFTQGLQNYLAGVSQLGTGAANLAGGLAEFESNSVLLAKSSNEIYKAGLELNGAVKSLRDGISSYKNGTKQFKDQTSDINLDIENKIEEMIGNLSGSNDKVISFVSDKNTSVSAVQFVLKTDSIKLPVVKADAEIKEIKLSFWQRLLRLFGIYV